MESTVNKEDIKVRVFDAYHEYVRNHYPKDPNIYVIRAHTETVCDLIDLAVEYQTEVSGYDWVGDGARRFLVFRLIEDLRLPPGDILFGPESIEIKWSK
jgi:hypothetical protein